MTNKRIKDIYSGDELDMVQTDNCNFSEIIDYWVQDKPVDPDELRYMIMSFQSLLHRLESGGK